jgi:hypothetical protein
MFTACWSVKGGSGTTVFAAALALSLPSAEPPGEALLVDLAGDLPAVLGCSDPPDAGISDWLAAGPEVPADALARLEVPVNGRLRLLPRGTGPLTGGDRGDLLTHLLLEDPRPVIVDCGTLTPHATPEVPLSLALSATQSLLVLRPCYLALRRALAAPLRASRLVVLCEPGRALDAHDVEEILGIPVLVDLDVDPAVARAVDAGLLATRVPRTIERALRRAA